MPTKNPRLNLTLNPELYELIDELASLRGVSRASVVVDFLEAAEPTMRNLLVSLRAFMAAEQENQAQFLSNLEEAEQTLAPIVAAALERLESGGGEAENPRTCNTGVTPSLESNSEGPSRDSETTSNDSNSEGPSRSERGR